jgi:DNA-binding response OmpR family regulator
VPSIVLANQLQQNAYEATIARYQDDNPRIAPVAPIFLELDPAPSASHIVHHGEVRVDLLEHQAYANGKRLHLTPTEFRLLEWFLRQPGRAFTRAQLMGAAITKAAYVSERTIDAHVKSLRRKLKSSRGLIETIRSVGYRFREQTESGLENRNPRLRRRIAPTERRHA